MALYLITGGAGFIGSHLAHALVARGDRVRVLDDLSSGRLENLAPHRVGATGSNAPVEFLEGSITDPRACARATEGVFGIFHEAAQVSVPRSVEDPLGSYAINVTGTLQLLEAARGHRVERVVFAASSAAYGNSPSLPKHEAMIPQPMSPYAAGKVAGEHLMRVYAEVYGMKTASLRYFNVFGPRQLDDSPYTGVIALFARALLEGRAPTIYGDGEQTRDFTYVQNVVQANLLAMDRASTATGPVYNVGSGVGISINQLYSAIAEELGSTLRVGHAPARVGDVRDSLASVDKARTELGYQPLVGWREGLRLTLAWYRDRFSAR